MKLLAATSLVASVFACSAFLGTGPHVPSAYQGTTKITIANASDAEICGLALFTGALTNDNWLGDKSKAESIAPGAQRSFDVKPGTYHVIAALFLARARGGSCTNDQLLAAGGTGLDATVAINGPSLITIGPKETAPVSGTELIALPKFFNETGGIAGSQSSPEEAPPAEESSSSSSSSNSSSSSSSAPDKPESNKNCMASGATCDQSYQCCSNACVTHSPNNYCR